MLTPAIAREAVEIITSIEKWAGYLTTAQTIKSVYFTVSNSGSNFNASPAILEKVKAMRIAECEAAIAALHRRAAQIDLNLEAHNG